MSDAKERFADKALIRRLMKVVGVIYVIYDKSLL